MLYRNFAIATLIAAPLIVMAVQSFVPAQLPVERLQPVVTPVADSAPPPPPAYSPPPPVEPVAEGTLPFGQPMEGAGRPMLDLNAETNAPPASSDEPQATEVAQ